MTNKASITISNEIGGHLKEFFVLDDKADVAKKNSGVDDWVFLTGTEEGQAIP